MCAISINLCHQLIINKELFPFSHPEDVDLIIGGLTEISIEGAILGPTFVCIIGRQFRELKFGDRFWYEIEGQFTQGKVLILSVVTED